jgi:hypothetical protein
MQMFDYYLYLWQHTFWDPVSQSLITRTCFGITKNYDDRQNGYEGHVGHSVKFLRLWGGPERPIRSLEDQIKRDFDDYLVVGHRNFKYEWINEEIELDAIIKYVEWEIANTYIGVTDATDLLK